MEILPRIKITCGGNPARAEKTTASTAGLMAGKRGLFSPGTYTQAPEHAFLPTPALPDYGAALVLAVHFFQKRT